MIKSRIYDIQTAVKRFVKKTQNRLRYRKLQKHINPKFGNSEKLILYNKSRVTGPEPCVCHAPTRSLYFDMMGNVTACCFNRVHVLGVYPENSIDEIVNGIRREKLQEELCRQNFMYGCQHCHKLIEAGNFEGVEARLYDGLKDQGSMPSEIVFELDNTCNLECEMCHEGFSSSIAKRKGIVKVKSPYDGDFLKQLQPYIKKLKVAKFLGGEPFLINIYYEIWDLIIKLNPNCKINLQTNGTIFNKKVESYLQKGNFYIGVSIDSLDADIYESIRRNAQLQTVLDNLDRFIAISKRKNNYVNLSVCPMQQNWQEIPKMLEFCNKKKIFVYFNTVYTEGFAISHMSEEELKSIVDYYNNISFKSAGIIQKRNIRFFENLKSQINTWYLEKFNDGLQYKKRHEFTSEKVYEKLVSISLENEEVIKILNSAFNFEPRVFKLSDNDINNLNNLKLEDIEKAINEESLEQIQSRIFKFMETGKFGD